MQLLHPGELRVGTYFLNPPFEFIDKGARVGFEIDLTDAIARKLQLRPVFFDTRWEVILASWSATASTASSAASRSRRLLAQKTPGLKIVAHVPDEPATARHRFQSRKSGLARGCGALASLKSDRTYRSLDARWNLAEET
ncbi:MAG: transporter substrate-binding domain-containing protein [Acetobacteraceae bacterium]|nr:transporter substrate-binding domain-containing protein [Acetobacteraceae bacterium]